MSRLCDSDKRKKALLLKLVIGFRKWCAFYHILRRNEMSDELEKYDEFGDLSLSDNKGEDSNLDEYGVWIKKKPSADGEALQNEGKLDKEDESNLGEDVDIPFDFDGLDESPLSTDGAEKEITESDLVFEDEAPSDSSFADVDVSNFFTDLESNAESEEVTKKEEEEALKMDLNFDTVDSYMQEKEETDDFESMLNNPEISSDSTPQEVSEFDDFLSEINSSASPSASKTQSSAEDTLGHDIELSVEADESQDFSNIGNATNAEESVSLPSPVSEVSETHKKNEQDSIVVKSTVVEPENIAEIVEENRKVMGMDMAKKEDDGFNDVEALANDLASDSHSVHGNFNVAGGVVSVNGLDKITELLTEIVGEISSLKKEISTLKTNVHSAGGGVSSLEKNNEEQEEATGFFKDEDTDEAIALTGDELNNILITADFTEENEPSVENEPIDEDMGICEACSDETEEKQDDDFLSEKDVNFDDISLEDSKLDDFVIPEELDYSMLNSENNELASDKNEEVASTEGSDMSYLDESDAEDEVSVEIPETQDIAIESSGNEASSTEPTTESFSQAHKEGEAFSSDSEKTKDLSSNIKDEVKSVLAYMDQLLESLPEDKMKEFAESEYFEMYNRLFSELGIS